MKITRRRLVSLLPAVVTMLHARAQGQSRLFARKPKPHAAPAQPMVYFGTNTSPATGAKGIYAARFDAVHGQFGAPSLMAECVGPSFLAGGQLRDRKALYSVNEGTAQTSGVSTYAVDAASGALKLLGQVPAGGVGPCFVAVGATGHAAYVANYNSGTVASFSINADGTLSRPAQSIDLRHLHKHGPQADRQEASHPHSATVSPDNRYLLVCDLGTDTIALIPVDAASGRLGEAKLTEVRAAGSGPRHLAFHPNGRWVYVVDELTSRVDLYLWNEIHAAHDMPDQALLTDAAHSVSTLATDFHGANTAAEIAIGADGHFVYVSNRGEDSLAVFAINPASGALTPVQRIACGGKTPRHFTLDSTGQWLICSHQDSGSVSVFARDQGNGQLSGPVQTIAVPGAAFALFI